MLKNEKAGMEVQIGNLEADVRFLKGLLKEAFDEGWLHGMAAVEVDYEDSLIFQKLKDFEEGL